MAHLSLHDLRTITEEAISALPRNTAIKSGDRTLAVLVPVKPSVFKRADMVKLKAVLDKADELAKLRDPKEDEAVLAAMGMDTTNWNEEEVRKLLAER